MDNIMIEYDDVVIGRSDSVDQFNFYGKAAGGMNEKIVLRLIRYALEDVIGWTPEEAVFKADSDMIQKMSLDNLLKYIEFPMEVPDGSVRYILSRLYPTLMKLDKKKLIEEIYQTVLDAGNEAMKINQARATERLMQFPRGFFVGADGFYRYCICLKYLLEHFHPVYSVNDLYLFLLSANGKEVLDRYRLRVPADQFGISLLAAAYYLTKDDPDGDFYYAYYTYCEERAKVAPRRLKRHS